MTVTDLPENYEDGQALHGSDIDTITGRINDDHDILFSLVPWPNGSAAASKLVSIGDAGYFAAPSGNSTSTVGTGEMVFVVGAAATSISALWTHFYTDSTLHRDVDPSGPITFKASLNIVSSTVPGAILAGTGYAFPFTFGGRATATLDPGGSITADPLGITLAVGDVVAIRTFQASGTAYAPRLTTGLPGLGGFTATTDLTPSGSAAITASGGFFYGPSALLGRADGAVNAKSTVEFGDSIGAASGDYPQANYQTPGIQNGGFAIRALSGKAGLINAALAGDSSLAFSATLGSFRRLAAAQLCTSAIIEYGSNDLFGGLAATAVEATNLSLATRVRRMGVARVFLCTVMPRTTSTDNWATTVNQTVVTGNAERVAYNAWARAGCPIDPTTKAAVAVGTSGALLAGQNGHPITAVFDTAVTVESALNSGLWRPANRVVTGSMTSGSHVLTCPSGAFSASTQENGGDLGSKIVIFGAGAAGAALAGNCGVVSSGTQVQTDSVCATTVSGVQCNIGVMTVDGLHPTSRGHILAAPAIDVSKL